MISIFYPLGSWIDKVKLNVPDRFEEIKKGYHKVVGTIGFILFSLFFTIGSGLLIFIVATNPSPSDFYLMPNQTEQSTQVAVNVSSNTSENHSLRDINESHQMVHQESVPVSITDYRLQANFNPLMSTERVRSWVGRSIMEAHTLNFINADDVLNDMRWVFREDTFRLFSLEMNRSGGLLDSVKRNSLEMWFTPSNEVQVIQAGEVGNYRVWRMEVRGVLTFTGSTAEGLTNRPVGFMVLVEEVDPTVNPYGLVISQITPL